MSLIVYATEMPLETQNLLLNGKYHLGSLEEDFFQLLYNRDLGVLRSHLQNKGRTNISKRVGDAKSIFFPAYRDIAVASDENPLAQQK